MIENKENVFLKLLDNMMRWINQGKWCIIEDLVLLRNRSGKPTLSKFLNNPVYQYHFAALLLRLRVNWIISNCEVLRFLFPMPVWPSRKSISKLMNWVTRHRYVVRFLITKYTSDLKNIFQLKTQHARTHWVQ